jgi:hypothetical protein
MPGDERSFDFSPNSAFKKAVKLANEVGQSRSSFDESKGRKIGETKSHGTRGRTDGAKCNKLEKNSV